MRDANPGLILPLLVAAAGACAGAPPDEPAASPPAAQPPPSTAAPPQASPAAASQAAPELLGALTRAQIEAAVPAWKAAGEQASVDEEAARGLATVPPGAEVLIVLGTWCGDSRREVPRLWRALDVAGNVPFAIELVGVGRDKRAPGRDLTGLDVRHVPTFIVRRDGKEIGRIVESAPEGVERSLRDLLTGKRAGVITGRSDLAPAAR